MGRKPAGAGTRKGRAAAKPQPASGEQLGDGHTSAVLRPTTTDADEWGRAFAGHLDTLEPLKAIERLAHAAVDGLQAWNLWVLHPSWNPKFPRDFAGHGSRLVAIVREWQRRFVVVPQQLVAVHGPNAVAWEGESAKCWCELAGRLLRWWVYEPLAQFSDLDAWLASRHAQIGSRPANWGLPGIDASKLAADWPAFVAEQADKPLAQRHDWSFLLCSIANECAAARRAGESTEHAAGCAAPSLTDEQRRIVIQMMEKHPALCTLDDFETAGKLSVSRRTASDCLAYLCTAGLACRPQGKRKGATLTTKGQEAAAQLAR